MSTTLLQHALSLAKMGFHVFPLVPGQKLPAITEYPERASGGKLKIQAWWAKWPEANVGISTTRFGGFHLEAQGALLVVDVDNKKGVSGDDELLRLEMQGREFPPTLEQITPNGGRHLIYWVDRPVKQGTSVLGPGLDVRSSGGFIVGAGSKLATGQYRFAEGGRRIELAPAWMVEACGLPGVRTENASTPLPGVDAERAVARATHYLQNEAPLAVEGVAGDHTTFKVAAKVKDFGVLDAECFELMVEHWNDRCTPPWPEDSLAQKIDNAYRYGLDPAGVAAPEIAFDEIVVEPEADEPDEAVAEPITDVPVEHAEHPFQVLNREFAFVVAGGGSHILWETTDTKGAYRLEHLGLPSFHQMLASKMLQIGDGKTKPLSELWMRNSARRSYDGICFMPGRKAPPRFYNLWRGFAVEPAKIGEQLGEPAAKALNAFLDHALVNVCRGNSDLFMWLMGYFAHLVQRPWEKPLVALVFRGLKGVGKNALVDRIGGLLGPHYLLSANRRYLVGNFNGHLENCLLFTLDEAFWSGDKQAEGTLKDLITGKTHVIEHKGKEPYSVENCTRVVILGNEDWLVPATHDERRFAVFDVGDGRKQDRAFFKGMREGMENGGSRLLLRYLMDFDLAKIDVNAAPATSGLFDQKVNSLEPFYQWWFDCLTEGKITYSEFGGDWPEELDKERFRNAFRRYVKERQIRSRIPEDRIIGKLLKLCLPTIDATKKRREGAELINIYRIPALAKARLEWESYIGHAVVWE